MILKNFGADIEFFFQAWSLFCMKYYINFCFKKKNTQNTIQAIGYWRPLCPFIEII